METLDKHFRHLTRAVFDRHGFAYGEVIARWPDIAGEALARHCRPERIKWPRGSGEEARQSGGTLVIAAAPGRALDLQYEVPRIIERVNAFYGYGAIAAIKVVQASGPIGGVAKPAPRPLKSVPDQVLAKIEDNQLRAALARLGQAVPAASPGSPQGK